MGEDNPVVLLAVLAATVYFAAQWVKDYRSSAAGAPPRNALPGAVSAPPAAVVVAAVGGIVLVALETAGEYALGISGQQRTITWLFAVYTLAAAFLEELIFRGYVVIENRGKAATVFGVIAASIIFAALHPFLWKLSGSSVQWVGGTKGWFSTAMVFLCSLWFYAVRFMPLNPTRSLLPCFAAHAAKNASVIAVKAAQGFVVGLW